MSTYSTAQALAQAYNTQHPHFEALQSQKIRSASGSLVMVVFEITSKIRVRHRLQINFLNRIVKLCLSLFLIAEH